MSLLLACVSVRTFYENKSIFFSKKIQIFLKLRGLLFRCFAKTIITGPFLHYLLKFHAIKKRKRLYFFDILCI